MKKRRKSGASDRRSATKNTSPTALAELVLNPTAA
jgi:hypothetical protein